MKPRRKQNSELFGGFICKCLRYFTTAKISFTFNIIHVDVNGIVFLSRSLLLMYNILPKDPHCLHSVQSIKLRKNLEMAQHVGVWICAKFPLN